MSWCTKGERGSAGWLRLALWGCLRLGWPVGRALLWPITAWFLATSPGARAASREYLGRVLGRRARLADVARHFHTFASAVLDRVFLLSGRMQGFRIRTKGLEHVTAVLAEGRGCILLGAHLGSFEVLRVVAQDSPVPVWALMFRRNAGPLTALLDRLAPDLRGSIIEIGEQSCLIRAHEAVERGEIVGILADRAPAGHRTAPAPFLGAEAAFPAGPFILASTLGVPVVLFYGVRLGPRRYAVRFEPFAPAGITLRRSHREADLRLWAGRYAAAIGRACLAHPYNWFNFFPFWGRHDADETLGAREPAGSGRRIRG